MGKLRLSITMSLDGYVTAPDQSEENPLGVGGMELHNWFFPLEEFREAEMELSIAPVIPGGGSRLFEGLERGSLDLERARALDAPGVTHIEYLAC